MTPELGDYMRGLQVLAQLRATGMELTPDQWATTELGRAQRESEPGPGPEMEPSTLAALDQVKARNQEQREMLARVNVPWWQGHGMGFQTYDPGTDQVLDHSQGMDQDLDLDRGRPPDISKGKEPQVLSTVDGDTAGARGGDHVADQVPGKPADPITEFLKNDPDDQWSDP